MYLKVLLPIRGTERDTIFVEGVFLAGACPTRGLHSLLDDLPFRDFEIPEKGRSAPRGGLGGYACSATIRAHEEPAEAGSGLPLVEGRHRERRVRRGVNWFVLASLHTGDALEVVAGAKLELPNDGLRLLGPEDGRPLHWVELKDPLALRRNEDVVVQLVQDLHQSSVAAAHVSARLLDGDRTATVRRVQRALDGP